MKFKKVNPENKLKRVCAWCKKHHKNDKWVEPNENDDKYDPDTKITHGICPECSTKHFPE